MSEKFALMMIANGCGEEVDPGIRSMTVKQALEYMDLPEETEKTLRLHEDGLKWV